MKTTILVERETRQLLKDIGKKGQTYDNVITDLAKKAGLKESQEVSDTSL